MEVPLIRINALLRPAALGVSLAVAGSLAACADQPGPTSPAITAGPALAKAVNDKFVFNGVTLTDSDGSTILNATIFASTKITGKSGGTVVCDYQTANGQQYLGQFEAIGVSITTGDELKTFCIANFGQRQIR
jgi:hypothetical protein